MVSHGQATESTPPPVAVPASWTQRKDVVMAGPILRSRLPELHTMGDVAEAKQRTREHIIADLSLNLFERIALDSGQTVEVVRRRVDYGI